ncbi:hypothetical protein [Sphingosinicella sp.]|uniref:hypothetical protein n=1 Tax=Sphingosinicella sp. TaxID=1917971 RepID=UPI004037AA89
MIEPRAIVRAMQASFAMAATSGPALANSARLGGGDDLNVSLGRIVAALLVGVVLIVLSVLLIRQRGGKVDLAILFGRVRLRPRDIDVVETRRLSPHADICLVRYRDQEYLLLLGAGHGRVLSCTGAEPATAAEQTKG